MWILKDVKMIVKNFFKWNKEIIINSEAKKEREKMEILSLKVFYLFVKILKMLNSDFPILNCKIARNVWLSIIVIKINWNILFLFEHTGHFWIRKYQVSQEYLEIISMLYGNSLYELHSIQILYGISLALAVSCLFTLYNKTYFF